MKSIILGLLVAACAAGCAQQGEPQFGQQDAAAIRQRTQAYAQTFNAKDLEKFVAFYSGETVFMPPNAPTMRGRDSVAEFHKRLFAEGAQGLEMESKDVGGHGTLAYESGTFTLRRTPEQGPETRDRGKYMFIWRFYRAQNTWLIDYAIWSSDLPQRVETGAKP